MLRQTNSARSIARPLLAGLTEHPFVGRVLGVHRRACNVIDESGQIIALVLPEVGNGPFAIVIDGTAGIFDGLEPHQPVRVTQQALTLGQWQISLNRASVWEPHLPRPTHPPNLELMIEQVRPYVEWPNFKETTPLAGRTVQLARQAAAELSARLKQPQNEKLLTAAVAQLAGLGRGLTPAGDDYLLGTMAALWLTERPDALVTIAKVAGPKTTALSRAFLNAAADGEFIEPWHALVLAWDAKDRLAMSRAIERIARFGASSGRDALAGFANTLLTFI